MAKRYFNWKLAIVLLIGLVVLAGAAFTLRRWQRATRSDRAITLGLKAYDSQEWDEAATNLGRYLAAKPDDAPTLLKYADAQLKRRPVTPGSFQQAVASYRSVLRLDPNNTEAAEKLSELYLVGRTPGESELIARRYLEKNNNPAVRKTLALALLAQRKYQETQSELTRIIKENPDQVHVYELLGQLAEGRPQDFPNPPALWFDQAVANNPSSALAHIIRAAFLLRANDLHSALADFEQAEKLDPSDKTVRLRLALELIKANELERAREQLKDVQQTSPADPMLWQVWAQLAIKSGSKQEMATVAESSLKEMGSQSADFRPAAAELFVLAGEMDRATDLISQMRNEDVFPDRAAFLEGMVFERKGELRKAIDSWNRAIELARQPRQSGGGYSLPDPRARLALASAFSRLGDTQSALSQLRTLVSERPGSFDARMAFAKLLALTRNWSEASEQARRATELAPGNPESVLLEVQTRMQLLAADQPALGSGAAQAWSDVEKRLAELDESTKGALEVRLLQVQAAMLQGELDKAEAGMTKLKGEHPNEMRVALTEVEILLAAAKEEQAISRLSEMIRLFPDSPEPVRLLALLRVRRHEQDKCEALLTEALARMKQTSDKRELGLLLAELYANWNQPEKEYELLTGLAEDLPDDLRIKGRLLACSKMTKDHKQSQKLVDEIKALQGENGCQWRYEQARVWYNSEDFKNYYTQAISLLQQNLLANPQDQASRLLLAATYERTGELQLAISTYREALSRSPDNVAIIIPTVSALYKAQEFAQAEELLNRAAEQKLYHPDLQKLQLQTHLRRGQLGSAADILQDWVTRDPNNVSAGLSLAMLLSRQGKFTEAQALLNKLKVQEPDSSAVVIAQIQLYVRQKNADEAVKLCNEVVKNRPNAFAYVLRARTYAALERPDKALEDFDHAISAEPNNPDAWVARSSFLRSTNRIQQAMDDIRRALTLAPKNITVQKLAVSTLLASGSTAGARRAKAILEEALEANPNDVELQLFNARFLLSEGTAPAVEKAQEILRSVTETNPAVGDAWALSAEILLRQGQSARAIDTILRGLTNKPNDRALLLLKARAEAARSPELAIPTLRLLAEQDPNDLEVAIRLAETYVQTGEPNKATELMRQQMRLCGPSARPRCQVALAAALYKNDKKDEAHVLFDTLLQSDSNEPIALLVLTDLLAGERLWAQVEQKVADWSEKHPKDTRAPVNVADRLIATRDAQAVQTAEGILTKTLRQNPDSADTMSALASLYLADGRASEASQLNQRILQVDPNNVIAMNNLAWALCEDQNRSRDALELADRGLKLAPQYVDLVDTRGVIYYRLGQHEKAAQDFAECVKLYPGNVPATVSSRFHLARALAKLGRKAEATQHMEQALYLQARLGGLSEAEIAEARSLLEKLKQGD